MQKIKLLLFMLGCMFINTIHAWTVTVNNRTNGEIKATIELAATSNVRDHVLAAGRQWKLDTGAYCIDKVKAQATSGAAQGKKSAEKPPATGWGISCKSLTVNVVNTASGGIAIEFN